MALPDSLDRRRRGVRLLARITAALMLATIVLSAYMRLTQTVPHCSPWPACGAVAQAAASATPSGEGVALARLAHRLVASAVLVLALLLVLSTLCMRPRLPAAGASALALLLLALGLAALGVTMRASLLPAVVLGNLLGGFLMWALALRLAAPVDATARAGVRGVRLALGLLVLQIAAGAWLSAHLAQARCAALAQCLQALPALGAGLPGLPALHVALALAWLPALGWVGWQLWRQGARHAALALGGLALLQVLLGGLLAPAGWPLLQALAHNLVAALLLALLLRRA